MIVLSQGCSKPLEHQVDGVSRLLENDGYALTWDMGLGKSAVVAYAIDWLLASGRLQEPKILIVAPKSLLWNWRAQLKEHAGLECSIAIGTPKQRRDAMLRWGDSRPGILVTSYETVRIDSGQTRRGQAKREHLLTRNPIDLVVADEAHRIKTHNSDVSKAMQTVAKRSDRRWALTGTPAPNKMLDVYGWMRFLLPFDTETWWAFRNQYALLGGFQGKQIIGCRNVPQLQRRVEKVSHRLKKEDVLDLPPKTFETVTVRLGDEAARAYRQLKKEKVVELGGKPLTAQIVLTESNRLLQICGGVVKHEDGSLHSFKENAKLDALWEIWRELDEENDRDDMGPPLVVFTAYRAEAEMIAKAMPYSRLVVGGMDAASRQEAVDDFQAGKYSVYVSTAAASAEGVTLTRASTVVFYSRGYNLTHWLQATDRVYRIGQTKPVTIVSLVAEGTIDAAVGRSLAKKQDLQELIVSGATAEELL